MGIRVCANNVHKHISAASRLALFVTLRHTCAAQTVCNNGCAFVVLMMVGTAARHPLFPTCRNGPSSYISLSPRSKSLHPSCRKAPSPKYTLVTAQPQSELYAASNGAAANSCPALALPSAGAGRVPLPAAYMSPRPVALNILVASKQFFTGLHHTCPHSPSPYTSLSLQSSPDRLWHESVACLCCSSPRCRSTRLARVRPP